jgi:hypothetical protein
MAIDTAFGVLDLVNEPSYSFGSADNVRAYPFAKNLAEQSRPTSIHGVLLDGEPLAIFGGDGGCSSVHAGSLAYVEGHAYLALGNCVVCFVLRPFAIKWVVQTDPATCFGIYFDERHQALISHGELEIARLSRTGGIVWSASGADIFSEPISLLVDSVKAVDFNGRAYYFRYEDGRETGTPTKEQR